MKNYDFIVTSSKPWDSPGMEEVKNLALEISRNNRVLYVNPPRDIIRLMKKSIELDTRPKTSGGNLAIKQEGDSLWILEPPVVTTPVNIIKYDAVFDVLLKRNNRKLSRAIFWAINNLEFEDIIHINYDDLLGSFYLKELLIPKLSVFLRRGNHDNTPALEELTAGFEERLIHKSDLVLTSPRKLRENRTAYNNNVFSLHSAVDFSNVSPDNFISNSLKHIPRPIIGGTGPMKMSKVSPGDIYDAAKERPDWSFVLVGEEDEWFESHPVHDLPNVYIIHEDRPEKFPAYINEFDVCLYPYSSNASAEDYHKSICTCFYMRKPVIAPYHYSVSYYQNYIHTTKNPEELCGLIGKALEESKMPALCDSRKRFAEAHDVKNVVSRIYKYIDCVMDESYPDESLMEIFSETSAAI